MCLAAWHNKGKRIPTEYLHTAWHNNHDGAGVLYSNGKSLVTHKTLRSFDEFMSSYELALRRNTSGVTVHFRRASVGNIDLKNVHPFVFGDLGFVHNGTIYNVAPKKGKSDTLVFGETILSKLNTNDIFKNGALQMLISSFIGSRSKLILMNLTKTLIFNMDAGEWNDGVWYSNGEYRQLKNRLNLDYGYCCMCDKRLFGKIEQHRQICNECFTE